MTIKLSRRKLLRALAVGSGTTMASSLLPTVAWASTSALAANSPKFLIVNLNGGLDGLYALQPVQGSVYSTLQSQRPTLSQDASKLLSTDGRFGLHPNLTALKALWDEGTMNAVLGVGYKNMSRSHLDAEITFERGVSDRLSSSATGLLDRLGSAYSWDSLRAISVTGASPIFAGGHYSPIQPNGVDDFYFRSFGSDFVELHQAVDTVYSMNAGFTADPLKEAQGVFLKNVQTVINTTDTVQDARKNTSIPTSYADDQFGKAFRSAHIALSSSQINSQVVYLRTSGFDTHSTQKTRLDQLLLDFNKALGAFVSNMKANGLWNNMIVMVFSEFGRTNRENGSGGTDHGGANPTFLLGGLVKGGSLFGDVTLPMLTDYGWLPMQYNVIEIYRRILAKMNLDPDLVCGPSDGPTLTSLFA